MNDDELIKYYTLLKNLDKNIRKSINNKNRASTLERHLKEINFLILHLEIGIKKSKLSEEVCSEIIDAINSAKNGLTSILYTKLNMAPPNETPQPTNNSFDLRTATAVVVVYDGASDGLQAFIDACNLLKDLTTEDHQQMLLKFLKTRVTGKARLGLPVNINTFDEFIKNVKERCRDTTSIEQTIVKLKSIKQRENLDSFCEQIENISNKLKNIYIEKQIPENVATDMVKKAAIDALINGVSNQATKLILNAGSFDSIKDAIRRVQENGSSQNQAILTFTSVV